jgi:DNA-binding XRE family transcriptional regulator
MSFRIRNQLRYYRERLGFSQQELAQISQVHKVTICNIETKKTGRPHPKTRKKLAKAMNMSIHRLFSPVKPF